jgi:transketolase
MVQQANSGHPGFPLGAAPIIYTLFSRHLRFDTQHPQWFDRDRFVLSAGHGSAMLYAMLHLLGYPELPLSELQAFRQFGSKTPGHPEYRHTPGVEATTGPLGAGMGMAVGMAIAEAHLASVFNRDGLPLVDHYTYVLGGDGCMMEGVSYEAFSLAGTLGLGKLIVLYDSNGITIEGKTDIAFTEDVIGRFDSFGFHTQEVLDGNDIEAISAAIDAAKAETERPSLIKINTHIAYGVPERVDTPAAHGEPLGAKNIAALRESLDWEYSEPFFVPEEVYSHFNTLAAAGAERHAAWIGLKEKYASALPDEYTLFQDYLALAPYETAEAVLSESVSQEKPEATRNIFGDLLNKVAKGLPHLMGGSADLSPSNKTYINGAGDFSKEGRKGRNIHFGVRENAMGAIAIGMALHEGLQPYTGTFLVFADYMKPMIRLAALMKLRIIFVFTHDSIGVGEDGPTHEPVDQLTMLRAIPGLTVIRPADRNESIAALREATLNWEGQGPVALALSRQNLEPVSKNSEDPGKGGYIVYGEKSSAPDVTLIATGSEVFPSIEAAKILEAKGRSARVVSMPSQELFAAMPEEYRDSVIPPESSARIAVEAGSRLSWGTFIGPCGGYVTMDGFGASAPAGKLFEKFGFTAENIAAKAEELIDSKKRS